jgi:hypothetical protein
MGQVTVLGVWQRLLMVTISPGWLFATVRPGPQLPGRRMADAVARREKKITCEYLTLTGWPFAPGCAECAVLARLWWPVEG